MKTDLVNIYPQLARFLDDLPAGYPGTGTGIELRILQKLFSPEEARIFMQLSLLGESTKIIAYRLHQPVASVSKVLVEMEQKGLISGNGKTGDLAEYSVNQFVIGFYEDQVNHLDRELAELIEEYFPYFFKHSSWTKVPQIRTIPVGVSIPVKTEIMSYERAEEIISSHTRFAVRNCVCRQEQHIMGKGCNKPLETCLSFDGGAEYTVNVGRGRMISQAEALEILRQADQAGLVLEPGNSKDPGFMCACCGCCCGVLRGLKMQEKPADLVANPFIASYDQNLCLACNTCIERCQMEAFCLTDGTITFNADRCIGCGLCVTTCPSIAVTLIRKPVENQTPIPANTTQTYLKLAWVRGKLKFFHLAGMFIRSRFDRLLALRAP
jgi:Na+-translocating ferredoxin:NAD+ oxidoreductase subunit B